MPARHHPILVAALIVLAMTAGGCGDDPVPVTEGAPSGSAALTYVAEARCRSCHLEIHRAWEGSHHQLAMQAATGDTILGDFEDRTFERHGVESRFYRKGDEHWVRTDGPGGAMQDYRILYAFGVEPLQQYLVDIGDGRIQTLPLCWDVENKTWFHVYDEPIHAGDPLHWATWFQNWNYMCAECHVTGYDKGYDAATNGFDSAWHAIGVGCQACHGPGSAHMAWAKTAMETGLWDAADPKGLAVDLGAPDAAVQVETCARCHARRDIVYAPYEHGRPFLDHYEPELLIDPLYFPDGQILDEVYVYGSFLQSKKHGAGVRCTDCHDPHTARLEREGNATCTECHRPDPPARFPMLKERAKVYDDPSHHHHPTGTPGAFCVDCHMPETTYMQVDPRRDHGFRIPRPDLTERLGVPNACTGCHEEKDAAWAQASIESWFPTTAKARHQALDPADVFARARKADPEAVAGLVRIARNGERAGIVRATALRELGRFGDRRALDAARAALDDDDGIVRLAAVELVHALVGRDRSPQAFGLKKDLLAPRLRDATRAVRVQTALALAGIPDAQLEPTDREALRKATDELVRRQEALQDRPDAWLNLGSLRESQGDDEAAEKAYTQALRMAPDYVPVRFNLAMLLNRAGRNDDAERLLREVVALMPKHGEAHYSLGLLLAEMERYRDAAASLSSAASLMPGRPRVHYNRALVLQHLGRLPEAEQALEQALRIDPQNPGVLHALVLVHVNRRDYDAALPYARKLTEILPNDPGARQLLHDLERRSRTR